MNNLLAVLFYLSIIGMAISWIVVAVIEVVEHFQYRKDIKMFERMEEKHNENNA